MVAFHWPPRVAPVLFTSFTTSNVRANIFKSRPLLTENIQNSDIGYKFCFLREFHSMEFGCSKQYTMLSDFNTLSGLRKSDSIT